MPEKSSNRYKQLIHSPQKPSQGCQLGPKMEEKPDLFTEQAELDFLFEAKDIFHLWLVEILPGSKFYKLKYDFRRKKIIGLKKQAQSKVKQCQRYLDMYGMKMIGDVDLQQNQIMYIKLKIHIKIFTRDKVEKDLAFLIKNYKLQELIPTREKILSKKKVYVASVRKNQADLMPDLVKQLQKKCITRSDLEEIKKKEKIKPKKKYLERSELKKQAVGSAPSSQSRASSDSNVYSSSSDSESDNSPKVDDHSQDQNSNYYSMLQTLTQQPRKQAQSNKKPKVLLKYQFPGEDFDISSFEGWVGNNKILKFNQFKFEQDTNTIKITLETTEQEGQDDKIYSSDIYFKYKKFLRFNLEESDYSQSFIAQFRTKFCENLKQHYRVLECEFVKGYVAKHLKEERLVLQYMKKKITQNQTNSNKIKIIGVFLKGLQPLVHNHIRSIKTELREYEKKFINVKKYKNFKDTLGCNFSKIEPYLYDQRVQDLIKQNIRNILQKSYKEINLEQITRENSKFVVSISFSTLIRMKQYIERKLNQVIIQEFQESIKASQFGKYDQVGEKAKQNFIILKGNQQKGILIASTKNIGDILPEIYRQINERSRIVNEVLSVRKIRVSQINNLIQKVKKQDTSSNLSTVHINFPPLNENQGNSINIEIRGGKKEVELLKNTILQQMQQSDASLVHIIKPLNLKQFKILSMQKYRQSLQNSYKDFKINLSLRPNLNIGSVIVLSNNVNTQLKQINQKLENYNLVVNLIMNPYIDESYLPENTTVVLFSEEEMNRFSKSVVKLVQRIPKSKFDRNMSQAIENNRKIRYFMFDEPAYPEISSQIFSSFINKINGGCKKIDLAFVLPKQKKILYLESILKRFYQFVKDEKINLYLYESSSEIHSLRGQMSLLSQKLGSINESDRRSTEKYYVVDHGKRLYYSDKACQRISQGLRNGMQKIYLSNQEVQIPEMTHKCSFEKQRLISLKNRQVFSLQIYQDKIVCLVNGFEIQLPQSQIKKVEKHSNDDPTGEGWVDIKFICYQIDLVHRKQTNVFTGFQRDFNAIQEQNPHRNKGYLNLCQNITANALDIQFEDRNKFKDFSNWVDQICKKQEAVFVKKIQRTLSEEELQKVRSHSQDLEVQFIYNQEKMTAVFKGLDEKSLKLVEKHLQIILTETTVSKKGEFPKYWQDQKQDIEVFEVSQNTRQFDEVQKRFQFGPIKKLLRIQNKIIYKKYLHEKTQLSRLNSGKNIKQMMLFHGTMKTDPKLIYEDNYQSFNINYSSERNYLGKGIYFAQTSWYSHNYAHLTPSGTKCMFYCQVLVGQSQLCDIQSCKRGAYKDKKDTNLRDQNKRIRYESSKTFSNHSNIYAVYKNRRAYPSYLIYYGQQIPKMSTINALSNKIINGAKMMF